MASISPVSIALYSSSVNVKNSATDLSCTYASVRYSFCMVVICAGGVWLIILFSGTDSIGLQLEVIFTRQMRRMNLGSLAGKVLPKTFFLLWPQIS